MIGIPQPSPATLGLVHRNESSVADPPSSLGSSFCEFLLYRMALRSGFRRDEKQRLRSIHYATVAAHSGNRTRS